MLEPSVSQKMQLKPQISQMSTDYQGIINYSPFTSPARGVGIDGSHVSRTGAPRSADA